MFRDDAQKNRALRALVSTMPRLRGIWTADGPPTDARAMVERGGRLHTSEGVVFTSGELVLLRVALDIYDGDGGARFSEVLDLGREVRVALGSLLVAEAKGAEAIDAWISEHAGEGGRSTPGTGRPCRGSGAPVVYDDESRRRCSACRATWPAKPRVPGQVRPFGAPPDLAPAHDIDQSGPSEEALTALVEAMPEYQRAALAREEEHASRQRAFQLLHGRRDAPGEGTSDAAPPALVDALVVAAISRVASTPGARVPLSAVRAELGALSDDAVTIALVDAERRGAIVLESSGDKPADDAGWWILGGTRGALCWARVASPA